MEQGPLLLYCTVSPGLTVDLRTGVLYNFIDYNLVFHTLKAISCYSFLLPGPPSPNTYVGCCFFTVTSLYISVSQHKVQNSQTKNNSSQLESQDVLMSELYWHYFCLFLYRFWGSHQAMLKDYT